MKKHTLRRCAAAIAACTVMAGAMPAIPFSASAAENIITNSTFDNGTTDWGTYKESGGVATLTTEDGKLALKVTNQGTLNYAVQMYYDIVPLYKNGVYRLKYDISASKPRFVESMIQQNGGTYQAYTWKGVHVTTEPQTVDYEFVMEEDTDIMAKFCFNCGLQEKEDGGPIGEHTIYLDNVSLELVDDSKVDYNANKPYAPSIITNQVGYRVNAKKTAVFRNTNGGKFSVVNADTNQTVFTGDMTGPMNNNSADETNYTGDFSSVTTPGKYFVTAEGLDNSYTFEIGDGVYSNLVDASVKMLYLQRCGTAVQDDKFGHVSCHDSIATIYGTDQKIDVTGGWHDAGDYGRYIVAAAKAVADLMYAYEANPEMYSDNIGIPESGNGTPDILDEVRYELEWMLKMQDQSDGGVYHKVSCDTFPGYVMPEKETKPLIVMPKSTTATADFAGSMAMAAEFYKDIDANFAAKCLDAAKKAYEWTKANPNVTYTNPADVVTGEYGDKIVADEIYWAAAQLYRATGDANYMNGVSVKKGLDWATVGDYGNIAILTMKDIDKSSDIYVNAADAVKTQASAFLSTVNASPYGSALTKYEWGSNMTIANAGIILSLAYNLTGNIEYLNAANAQLDYLLGSNPNGASFVTGFGTVSPENPHHRPSMTVGSAMPGMLVGGVNQNLEDSAAKAYCRYNPPAECWIDNAESYSTNEITIYWNSPLTYLLSLTDFSYPTVPPTTDPITPTNPTTPGEVLYGDANVDGKVEIADATLILQFLTNKDEYNLSTQGMINADCYDVGDGVTASDALAIQKLDAGIYTQLPVGFIDVPQTTTIVEDSQNTTTSTTVSTETNVNPANGIVDYGTPMNANATAVEDFRDGDSKHFIASDGWTNGNCFDCGWYKQNTSLENGMLSLTIDKDHSGQYNYSGAEYRTNDFYSYGYYETSMQAIKNDGVVSSFFTYTGPSDNNPWDEIDIEILGKDTTKVQLNYYTDGVGNHEVMYDLGFDASEGFHTYGFNWQPDYIAWFVDGKEVYRTPANESGNIPKTAGKIMMNTWPGITVDEWLNPFNGNTPLTAHYQWVTYDNK